MENENVNPVTLYLSQLQGHDSARVVKSGLDFCAKAISGGKADSLSLDWSKVRYPQMALARAEIIKHYSPGSGKRMLCSMRKVLKNCWLIGLIDAESYQRAIQVAPIIGERPNAGRYMEKAEIVHMIDSCDFDKNFKKGVRDRALITLAYTCGLRRLEICRLQIQDYNPKEKTILIHGKRNKQVTMNMIDEAVESLERWLDVRGREDGYIFTKIDLHGNIKNTELTCEGLYHIIVGKAKELNLEKTSPHNLRRAFASHLLDKGVGIEVVCTLLRHNSVNTTMRYDLRNKDKLKKEALEKLEL